MPADRGAHVVGRQGVLVRDQLVGAHQEGHPVTVVVGAHPIAGSGSCFQLGFKFGRSKRQEPAQQILDTRRAQLLLQGHERRIGATCPFLLATHHLHRVGGEERLEARGIEGRPVVKHGAAERHHTVRRLRVKLLAQKVHERVAARADLVDLRGDRTQLALGPDLVEIHGQRAQQLLGDEIDGADIGVQEARDVALEEVGVGDVHAAQAQLHVESRRQALVQGGVRLDDAHPAADLRQMIGIDHGLPLIGRPTESTGYWNFQYRMSAMRWSTALTLPALPMATPIAS